MKKIVIEVIPHKSQKYNTLGNYFTDDHGVSHVQVSDTGDDYSNFLIVLHEIYEMMATHRKGIGEEDITKFDIIYEAGRGFEDDSEPGDDPSAPYFNEHQQATILERLACQFLGMTWQQHEENCRRTR